MTWLFWIWAPGFVIMCFAQLLGNAAGGQKRSRWWILLEATFWPVLIVLGAWAIARDRINERKRK